MHVHVHVHVGAPGGHFLFLPQGDRASTVCHVDMCLSFSLCTAALRGSGTIARRFTVGGTGGSGRRDAPHIKCASGEVREEGVPQLTD
eukprot:634417-Prymnesium_polylepis.1